MAFLLFQIKKMFKCCLLLTRAAYDDGECWGIACVEGRGLVYTGILGYVVKDPVCSFMTKLCDSPYPIYDVTKNLKPYL